MGKWGTKGEFLKEFCLTASGIGESVGVFRVVWCAVDERTCDYSRGAYSPLLECCLFDFEEGTL